MLRCAALILSVLFVMQTIWLKCSIVSAGAKILPVFRLFFSETSPFVSVAVMSSLSLMANKETRTILRFRNLLRTVIEDNLFASKSMMTAPSMWQFQTLEILGPVITQPLDPTTMVRSRQRGVISSVCGTRGSATFPRRPYRKHPGSTRP